MYRLEVFLDGKDQPLPSLKRGPHHSLGLTIARIYLSDLLNCLDMDNQSHAGLPLHVTPSLSTIQVVPEFSTRLPIAYAIMPRLRTDLPWAD